jgi:ABC-type Fe3+-hydroxamate transport system substrate-binding protein
MKTQRMINLAKNTLIGILVLGMMYPVTSFAQKSQKVEFMTSSVVPAAKGYVKVKHEKDNKNYSIKVEIAALADVDRLQTSSVSYVVWMETDQGSTENLGQLNSSSGFLSKRMKASLETISSYKPSIIFVTAEENTNAQYPQGDKILSTDRF